MSGKRDIVSELLARNCLITPECYEILEDLDDDTIDIDRLAEELKDELVITAEKLTEALGRYEDLLSEGLNEQLKIDENKALVNEDIVLSPAKKESIVEQESEKLPTPEKKLSKLKEFSPIGKHIKAKVKILAESTGKTTVEGTIKDFSKYFRSRYKQLSAILKSRGDIGGAFRIGDLRKAKLEEHERIALIGMVTNKISLKNGGLMFEVEDPTGNITITIPSNMQEILLKAGTLLEDQVAAFYGKIYGDRLVLDDFVFPDIPLTRKATKLEKSISVCMTSDLHIGSKEFLEESFLKLVDFLNGRIDDPYQRTLASQVKYFIICGDLVEGIGIYPNQEEDLQITDIYKQYDYAAKLLSEIPEWIQIIAISGNHDACRLALPQPAISKEYAPKLWEMPNVKMLSNPSTVNLHGKTFLLYHGNSFEDISSLTPGLSMNDANGPMLYSLRYRHLAPTFGRRSSIVPSNKDELVIEHIPDVFHTGHIHINAHTRYRGVECINSGTFQSQTDFMLSKNIHPTPGRVPILNLMTNKLHEIRFYEKGEERI